MVMGKGGERGGRERRGGEGRGEERADTDTGFGNMMRGLERGFDGGCGKSWVRNLLGGGTEGGREGCTWYFGAFCEGVGVRDEVSEGGGGGGE